MRKSKLSVVMAILLLFAMLLGCVGCAEVQTDSTTTGGSTTTTGGFVAVKPTNNGNSTAGTTGENPVTNPTVPPVDPPALIPDGYYASAGLSEDNELIEDGFRFEGNKFYRDIDETLSLSGEYELTEDGQIILYYSDSIPGWQSVKSYSILITDTYIQMDIGKFYRIEPGVDYTGTVLNGYYTCETTNDFGENVRIGYIFENGLVCRIENDLPCVDEYEDKLKIVYQIVGNWIFFGERDSYNAFAMEDGCIRINENIYNATDFYPINISSAEELEGRYYERRDENGNIEGVLFWENNCYIEREAGYEEMWPSYGISDGFFTISGEPASLIGVWDDQIILFGYTWYRAIYEGEMPE